MNHFAVNDTMLTVRPIGPTFGAEVSGMPVHGDVRPELLTQFISLLHRYRVLIVPGLDLDPADLVAFSQRLGPLEIHSRFENTLPAHREVFALVVDRPDAVRFGVESAGAIVDNGVLGPAIPQRLDHRHELFALCVAVVVADLAGAAEIARRRGKP